MAEPRSRARRNVVGRALRIGAPVLGVGGELERQHRLGRTVRAFGIVGAVLLIGTAGYYVLPEDRPDPLSALYMAVITLTTVGFEEVVPVHGSPRLMLFTIGFTTLGVASAFHFFATFMAMVVEGDLLFDRWRRGMMRSIENLERHVVVAGAGSNGIHVIRELWASSVPLVVVEQSAERVEQLLAEFGEDLLHVVGDAHDDDVLRAAGLARARGLIAALQDDRDNLFLCVAARTINPDARIIAKAEEASSVGKFQRAGVDSIVSPASIGGRRLAHEMIQPHVTSFMEGLLDRHEQGMGLVELDLVERAELDGLTLADANLRERLRCIVVGIRPPDQPHYSFNPGPKTVLAAGMGLLVLGSREHLGVLRQLVTRPRAE